MPPFSSCFRIDSEIAMMRSMPHVYFKRVKQLPCSGKFTRLKTIRARTVLNLDASTPVSMALGVLKARTSGRIRRITRRR